MGLSDFAGPIGSAIGGAFNYAGGKAQADVAQNALDYEKQLKAKQLTAAQPYLSLGQMAVGRLPGFVSPGPVTFAGNAQSQPQPMSGMGGGMGAVGQSLVTVQAPTGETKQVPMAVAQHYVQAGAKIVGQ
jgi:hypothetical protein